MKESTGYVCYTHCYTVKELGILSVMRGYINSTLEPDMAKSEDDSRCHAFKKLLVET